MSRDRGLKSVAYDIACSFLSRCPQSPSTITVDLIEGNLTPADKSLNKLAHHYCQMLCDQIENRKMPVNIVHKAELTLKENGHVCEVQITDCRGRKHQAQAHKSSRHY